jgi:hypothetical protein
MEDEYATRSQTLPQVQNAQFSEEQSCDGRAAQNMRIAWSSRSKDGLGLGWITATCKQASAVWCNLVEGFKLVKKDVRLLFANRRCNQRELIEKRTQGNMLLAVDRGRSRSRAE